MVPFTLTEWQAFLVFGKAIDASVPLTGIAV